jgi:AbrB family looped-hinge helix DNA binding protein
MQIGATLTSKGQITIPKEVRDALGLDAGDRVYFQVREGGAVMTKVFDFIELAGSVPVPPELRAVPWRRIREQAWREATGRSR